MLELLRGRRSLRKFQERPVEAEVRARLEEALLRAPSSRNLRPWEHVVVDDAGLLLALSRCKPHGAAFVAGAPLAVVICGDPERCDVWVEDCSIAAAVLHFAATAEGLGSCWVQVRLRLHEDGRAAEDVVREVLSIPDHLRVLAIVTMGYPAEEKPGHSVDSLSTEKMHRNGW